MKSVKQEGWYRLTQPTLIAAGLDLASDPRGFRLYVSGREIDCHVTGAEDGRFDVADTVEFYGLGLDTAATDTRVYWLLAETHQRRAHQETAADEYDGSRRKLSPHDRTS